METYLNSAKRTSEKVILWYYFFQNMYLHLSDLFKPKEQLQLLTKLRKENFPAISHHWNLDLIFEQITDIQ
jgi:hypothetical protein